MANCTGGNRRKFFSLLEHARPSKINNTDIKNSILEEGNQKLKQYIEANVQEHKYSKASLNKIAELIAQYFNSDEMAYLMFAVEIEPSDVLGQSTRTRAYEFVRMVDRRGKISQLLQICAKERDNVSWAIKPVGGTRKRKL